MKKIFIILFYLIPLALFGQKTYVRTEVVGDDAIMRRGADTVNPYIPYANREELDLSGVGYINVTDYGALGNGSTDDLTAINDALTAGTGGVVYIPEGTFIFGGEISIPANTKLMGAGIGKTILKLKDHTATVEAGTLHSLIINATGTEGTVISDLTVDGNKANITGEGADDWSGADYAYGIDIRASDYGAVIQNVEIKNVPGWGLHLADVTGAIINNLLIHDNAFVGLLTGAIAPAYTSVNKCTFSNIVSYDNSSLVYDAYDQFYFYNARYCTFNNLVAYTSWTDGALPHEWSTGFKFDGCEGSAITGLVARNNPGIGLHLNNSKRNTISNVAITKNYFPTDEGTYSGISMGLLFTEASHSNILNNILIDSAVYGGFIYDTASSRNMFNNLHINHIISASTDKGYGMQIRGNNTTINGAVINNCDNAAIMLDEITTSGTTRILNADLTKNKYSIYNTRGSTQFIDVSGTSMIAARDTGLLTLVNSNGYTVRKKTIGWDGATGTDFKFAGNANHTAQNIDLGHMIPTRARIVGIEIECTEAAVGVTDITFRAGNASAGEQFIASSSCDELTEIVGIIDATKPAAVGMNVGGETHIFIGADPTDATWGDMTAGKWTIYITYIVYK